MNSFGPIRLIIAGSREFEDYHHLHNEVVQYIFDLAGEKDYLHINWEQIEIVSGTARGADQLGECFADRHGCLLKRFPADWKQYGKRAGPIRNGQMADYGTHCIVFWSGIKEGSGSYDMIQKAVKKLGRCRVVQYVTGEVYDEPKK